MKMIANLVIVAVLIITFLLVMGYYFQHLMIFFPEKLSSDYEYSFDGIFEEKFFETDNHIRINALHFKVDHPKGIIFYLHGNAGSLSGWGDVAYDFTTYGYDVLIIDYRGFGKSTGKISEEGLYHDAQFIYDDIKKLFNESKIIVYGRSIGTGIASFIASKNQPAKLILESPYYSLPDLAKRFYPWFPEKFIRFQFRNDLYVERIECPIYIIHGTNDEIINVEASKKLARKLKPLDSVILISGGHHNDLSSFDEYHEQLNKILK